MGIFDWFFTIKELWTWIDLSIRLVVFLFILSFFRNRLGNTLLSLILTLIVSYFVLIEYWWFFSIPFILYILMILGVTSVLFDLVLTKPWRWKREGISHSVIKKFGPRR